MIIDYIDREDRIGKVNIEGPSEGQAPYLQIVGQGGRRLSMSPLTVGKLLTSLREGAYEIVPEESCQICREEGAEIVIDQFRDVVFHQSCLQLGLERCRELIRRNSEVIMAENI